MNHAVPKGLNPCPCGVGLLSRREEVKLPYLLPMVAVYTSGVTLTIAIAFPDTVLPLRVSIFYIRSYHHLTPVTIS